MFSTQMIEVFENTPILHNNNTSFTFWLTLYIIMMIYPYQYIWYVPYVLVLFYSIVTLIVIKFINDFMI